MQVKTNTEFALVLEERTKKFTIEVLRIGKKIPFSNENKAIKNQLYRSAGSVGANYREANRAKSRSDFRNKIRICEAESSETVYWLEILNEITETNSVELKNLMKESRELLALFTRISNKLRVSKKD